MKGTGGSGILIYGAEVYAGVVGVAVDNGWVDCCGMQVASRSCREQDVCWARRGKVVYKMRHLFFFFTTGGSSAATIA